VVTEMGELELEVIGVVRTGRRHREHTPVQSALNRHEQGSIEIDPRFEAGLDGLSGFDYAWVLSWLGEGTAEADAAVSLRQSPFLLTGSDRLIGIFATRGPRRVNPIGLSLVELVSVQGCTIRFAGVDLVDGTPVVDLKPYVTRFDSPPDPARCGWFDDVELVDGSTPFSLRSTSGPSTGSR
jgi:tRNA-Thr(GGU) m(6)t(6)A37 methyltransferase TsaA